MSAEILRAMAPAVSGWHLIDQARIDAFAELTADRQYIHLDPVRAAETPFGGTVAHGFLTLSMLSAMSYEATPDLPGLKMGVNYGFDKLRFVTPVRAGRRIRGHFSVADVAEMRGRIKATWDVSVEIEGEDRPALVASWLNVFEMEE